MKTSILTLFYVLAAMLATVTMGVHAEHEANHRYVVRGYVLDVNEVPLANVPVSIRVNAKTVGSAQTNTNGYYSLQTHLHDEDLGKLIEVRAGAHSGTVRMQGKQGDLSSARIHSVSFIGERLVEDDLGKFRFPAWGYIVIFVGVLTVLAVRLERLRKRRQRLKPATAVTVKPKKQKRKRRKGR